MKDVKRMNGSKHILRSIDIAIDSVPGDSLKPGNPEPGELSPPTAFPPSPLR